MRESCERVKSSNQLSRGAFKDSIKGSGASKCILNILHFSSELDIPSASKKWTRDSERDRQSPFLVFFFF